MYFYNAEQTPTFTAHKRPEYLLLRCVRRHKKGRVPHRKGKAQESTFQNLTESILYYIVLYIVAARKSMLVSGKFISLNANFFRFVNNHRVKY
jgi:hypothetical protein